MEYDPAFPTGDIMKKKKKKKKLSSIPLPGLPQTSLSEIPMPAIPTDEIEIPPELPQPPSPVEPVPKHNVAIDNQTSQSSNDSQSQSPQLQPVKFQMKVTSKPSTTSESSESAKLKTLTSSGLVMRPPLKVGASHVKRMRAGVLPTGVLGAKKKTEEAPVPTNPTAAIKEPERFVPPTIIGPPGVDPSVTLTSEMLDAAKRAINQINSALLGVSNTLDSSASISNISRNIHQPPNTSPVRVSSNRPQSTSGNASSSPSGMKGSNRDRSPASKRRRSPSGPRGERSSKRKRHSSDSSSSSSPQASRSKRRTHRRSRSTKRHRRRSSSRNRYSKSSGKHRRRSGSGRSRSPPQSRRGRSRSLRKALSQSDSDSRSTKRSTGDTSKKDDKGRTSRRQEDVSKNGKVDPKNTHSGKEREREKEQEKVGKGKRHEHERREKDRSSDQAKEVHKTTEKELARKSRDEKVSQRVNDRRDRSRQDKRDTKRVNEKRSDHKERENQKSHEKSGPRTTDEQKRKSHEKVVKVVEKNERHVNPDKQKHFSEHHLKDKVSRKLDQEKSDKIQDKLSDHISRTSRDRRKDEKNRSQDLREHKRADRISKPVKEEIPDEAWNRNDNKQTVKLTAKPVALDHLMEEVSEESDNESERLETTASKMKSEPSKIEKVEDSCQIEEKISLYEPHEIKQEVQEITSSVEVASDYDTKTFPRKTLDKLKVEKDLPEKEPKVEVTGRKVQHNGTPECDGQAENDRPSLDKPVVDKTEADTSNHGHHVRHGHENKSHSPRLVDKERRYKEGERNKSHKTHLNEKSKSNFNHQETVILKSEPAVAGEPSKPEVVRDKRRKSPAETPEPKRLSRVGLDSSSHRRQKDRPDHELTKRGRHESSTDHQKDKRRDSRRERSRSRQKQSLQSPNRSHSKPQEHHRSSESGQKIEKSQQGRRERTGEKDRRRGKSRSSSREGSRPRRRFSSRHSRDETEQRSSRQRNASGHGHRSQESEARHKETSQVTQPTAYKSLKEEAEERARRRKEEESRREKQRGDTLEDSNRRKERRRSHSHSPSGERTHTRSSHYSGDRSQRHRQQQEKQSVRERSSGGRGRDRDEDGHLAKSEGRERSRSANMERKRSATSEVESDICQQEELAKPRTPPPLETEVNRSLESESQENRLQVMSPKGDSAGETDGEAALQQKAQSAEFLNILKKFDVFFTALSNMTGNRTHATVAAAAAAAASQQATTPNEKKADESETKALDDRLSVTDEKDDSPSRNKSVKEKGRYRRRQTDSVTSSSAMSVSGGSSVPGSPDINEISKSREPSQMYPSALTTTAWQNSQLNTFGVNYKQTNNAQLLQPESTSYSASDDATYPSKAYLEGHITQLPHQQSSEQQWLQSDHNLYPPQNAVYVGQHYPSNLTNEEYQHYYYQQQQQQQSQQYQYVHQQQLYDSHNQYAQQVPWQLDPSFTQSSSAGHRRSSQTSIDFLRHVQGMGQVGLPNIPQQYHGMSGAHQDVHTNIVHPQTCDANVLNYSLQIATDQPIVKRYDEGWITSGSTSQMSPIQTPLVTPTNLPCRNVSRSGRPETPLGNIDGDRLDSDFEAHADGEDDMDDDEDDEFEEEEGSLGVDDGPELSAGEGSVLEVELGEEDHPSLAPDDISSVGDKELELLHKDELNLDNWTARPHTPPLEEQYPDAPKPIYEHIEASEFRSKSVMRSRSKLETNRWVCDCTVPNPDEAAQGMRPCGEDCINRVLNIECSSRCPISELCTNRQFQEKKYAPIEPYYAGKDKGWGLRARDRIMPGTFVIEYVGEVIDFREFKRRIVSYEKEGHAHHYFMALEADSFIDAGTKGNWARFVNHSCDSNSETQKWNVLGQIRIGFFAKRMIEKGEEITIDYQFVQYGRHEQKCYCGATNCNGIMGSTSKQLQDKVRMKDTRTVERRLAKLLSMECLRNAEDVHMLLKVLVQEYLMRDIRFDLLGVVLQTESEACLKMFRQYNGLELIASYMRDSDANDWTMKTRLLEVLDKIPVFEQKQLKAGTNLFGIVRQWSVDPRFCRQRNAPLANQSSCGGSGSSGSARGVDSVVPSPATTATTNEDGDTVESVAGVPDIGSVSGGPDAGTVLSAVDLETGEKTGLDTDEDTKHWRRIRDAAERLLFKWQQLPDEIYRIPKVERHETEQSLQPSSRTKTDEDKISRHRSSVLSSSQSRAPLYSWGLPVSEKKRPASPSSRASEGSLKPGTASSSNVNLGTGTPRLPKDEFRRLFEAYVRFEEEQKKLSEEQKKLSEQRKQHEIDLSKIHDPSLQDAVEKIRQLLSRTLLHAIEQLKRGMQPQLVLPPDLTEVAQDEKVQRLLGELQHVEMSQLLTLLSGYDGSIDGPVSSSERGNVMMPGRSMPIAGPEEQLPPNWKWARDRDGRLYFYHVLTKKTQWEAPLYPWDAGDDDPHAYCYNNAHLYQVTHDEIAAMHVRIQKILKEKAKNEKLQKKKSSKKCRKDPNWQEKQKVRFHKQMYKIIASHLHKYRSADTKIGRITNSSDLKYLGKKLAQTILHKELKRVRIPQDLEVNASVTSKAITYVDKYMVGRGAVYTRRSGSQKRHMSSTPALSPSELSVSSKRQRQKEKARNTQPSVLQCQSQDKQLHIDEKSSDSLAGAVNDFVEQPHSVSFQNEKLSDDQEPYTGRTLYIDQEFNDKTNDTFNEDSEQVPLYSVDQIMADDELKELDNLL